MKSVEISFLVICGIFVTSINAHLKDNNGYFKNRPRDCTDIDIKQKSGVYKIYPEGSADGFNVYCDMMTESVNGGWTTVERVLFSKAYELNLRSISETISFICLHLTASGFVENRESASSGGCVLYLEKWTEAWFAWTVNSEKSTLTNYSCLKCVPREITYREIYDRPKTLKTRLQDDERTPGKNGDACSYLLHIV
ncbi:unnamed protein product [Mytilus edulis]|uniref:Fibrinogen C-terminal domain-containing protein n=1 Tax=Mytilus edulis TaxID=6550 RepID=A0A8S3UMA0_MYTED|nr:unnamed protein product [Mytilus edulis]